MLQERLDSDDQIGCYVSNMEDKLITPGTYITAGEYHSKRLRAVRVFGGVERETVLILCFHCSWQMLVCVYVSSGHYTTVVRQALLAKCFTDSLRQAKEQHLTWLENEKRRKKEEKKAADQRWNITAGWIRSQRQTLICFIMPWKVSVCVVTNEK